MVCMRIESVKSLTRHESTCHSGVSNPIIRNSRWMSGGKPLHNACRFSVRCTFLIEICLAPKHSHATQCGFYLDNVLPVLNENEERPIMSRGVNVYTILDSSRGDTSSVLTGSLCRCPICFQITAFQCWESIKQIICEVTVLTSFPVC